MLDQTWSLITAKSANGVARTSLRSLGHPARGFRFQKIFLFFPIFASLPSARLFGFRNSMIFFQPIQNNKMNLSGSASAWWRGGSPWSSLTAPSGSQRCVAACAVLITRDEPLCFQHCQSGCRVQTSARNKISEISSRQKVFFWTENVSPRIPCIVHRVGISFWKVVWTTKWEYWNKSQMTDLFAHAARKL